MPMALDIGNIRITLVEPEGSFNIGSVARIMKNMGPVSYTHLTLPTSDLV